MRAKELLSPSIITLLVAICASVSVTYVVINNAAILPSPVNESIALIIALAFGTAIPASFYAAFHHGLFMKKMNPFSDPRSLISELSLVQIMAVLLYNAHRIDTPVFYTATVTLQSWATWLSFSIAINGIKIPTKFSAKVPWIAAATVAGFGFLAFPVRNFWPTENLLIACGVWQAAVHIVGLSFTLGWFALHPRFRLDQNSVMNSIRLRIDNENKRVSEWTSSFLTALIQMGSILSIAAIIKYQETTYPLVLAISAPFLYLPSLVDAWTRLDQVGTDQERLQAFSRLTVQSARNLLTRHNQGKDNWAATVGLRTTTFTIDHDPESTIGKKIPATLARIRNEEIAAFVNQIMKDKTLSVNSISQKILGSIDPEHSIRPCVDALNLCATLYLDAGALVERRISGLMSLLPLVNQGLADIINLESLLPILTKTQWFFHFDYNWVDQSIVSTQKSSRYGIHLEPISPEARIAMLDFMRRTHSIGNFIWVGKDAHDRLLQEAPNLTTIMEPHTINVTSENDLLVFSIKFEHLIPRLQRYYGLDDTRAKVIDFEPGAEAQRLLSIMSLQTQNSKTPQEKLRIIESIASYTWRGFKEKDQALKLLLKIYLSEAAQNAGESQKAPGFELILKTLRAAVTTIGYPSQILNQAQLYKTQLRDLTNLRANALDPHSARFEEAWVLLGNLDYQRHTAEDAKTVREILGDALRNKSIMKTSLVQGKLIDTTVSLIRRGVSDELNTDTKMLVKITEAMLLAKAGAESLSLALDAFAFVAQTTGIPVQMSDEIIQYLDAILKTPGNSDAWNQSLKNRWQEYRSIYLTDSHNRKSA